MDADGQNLMAHIWTRDGYVELKETKLKTSANRPESRIEEMISEYVSDHLPHVREAMSGVYRRAYRRAGIIPGDPDEITAELPARNPFQELSSNSANSWECEITPSGGESSGIPSIRDNPKGGSVNE